MKKYENTKLFILLSILLAFLMVVFGVFIYKYSSIDKEVFDVEEGSILYTDSLQYIKVEKNARIEKKLDGKYYLYETISGEVNKFKLGKSVIVSKNNNSFIDLYGDAYQVLITGNVVYLTKKNKVSKSNPTKLFKLDDRKYLMVDSNLYSKGDNVVKTSGYVYIELDKNGNATFANNEILFKTINPIVLSGSQFDFDIANEKILFDKNDIDLKSIIGSSNTYKKVESSIIYDSEEENEDDEGKTETGKKENGTAIKDYVELDVGYYDDYLNSIITSVNNLTVSLKNTNDVSSKLLSQKTVYYDFNKWVALKSVSSTSSSILINYSVFDPNSEYDKVFVRLKKGTSEIEYELNTKETTYRIENLKPDNEYTIQFGYYAKNREHLENDGIIIVTSSLNYDLKVNKIRSSYKIDDSTKRETTIFYTLKADSDYMFERATLEFSSVATNNENNISKTVILSADENNNKNIFSGSIVLGENEVITDGSENVLRLHNLKRCPTNTACIKEGNDNNLESVDFEISYKFYNN